MAGSSPNRDRNGSGAVHRSSATARATVPTHHTATPITRWMSSIFCRPQYWLNRTVAPLWTPKMNICTINRGIFARATAAIGSSPSRPTMKVSAIARVLVIRFCSTIGRASAAT